MKTSKWIVLLALAGALPATLLVAVQNAAEEPSSPRAARTPPKGVRPQHQPPRPEPITRPGDETLDETLSDDLASR